MTLHCPRGSQHTLGPGDTRCLPRSLTFLATQSLARLWAPGPMPQPSRLGRKWWGPQRRPEAGLCRAEVVGVKHLLPRSSHAPRL